MSPAVDLSEPGEVWLGDTFFPIRGPVREVDITVTPSPIILGDSSRQGEAQVMSQLIQSRFSGGVGLYRGNPRTDFERCWRATWDTRWQYPTLPPKETSLGAPDGVTTDPQLLVEHGNELYVAWGSDMYRWLNPSSAWSSKERALPAVPTSAVSFLGSLYVATGQKLDVRGSDGTWSRQSQPAAYLCVFDSKLWALGLKSSVWTVASSPDGSTWTDGGTIPESTVTPNALVVYRNVAGDRTLYAVTDNALWVYDDTSNTWSPEDIRYTRETRAGRNALVFSDARLYFPSGRLGMISVQSGNPLIASAVGLDRDDGVPASEDSSIAGLTADTNWIFAILDGTKVQTATSERTHSGSPLRSVGVAAGGWPEKRGVSTVRPFAGTWKGTIWESGGSAYPGTCILVAQAYDTPRLYWGADRAVWSVDLPRGIFNPRHNPTQEFTSREVELVTPWWYFVSEGQESVVPHVELFLTGASSDESVDVSYGTDLDDDTWTLIGTASSDGRTVLKIASGVGVTGRFFRFKLTGRRGSTTTNRPIVEYFRVESLRLLPSNLAWAFEVDLSRSHRGKSPYELYQALNRLADAAQTSNLIPFAFTDDLSGTAQTYYGRITRRAGLRYTGRQMRGRGSFMVSFIVPYPEDAI